MKDHQERIGDYMQIDMGMNVIRAGQIEKDEFEHILEEHSK